jgi:hypothetical protein
VFQTVKLDHGGPVGVLEAVGEGMGVQEGTIGVRDGKGVQSSVNGIRVRVTIGVAVGVSIGLSVSVEKEVVVRRVKSSVAAGGSAVPVGGITRVATGVQVGDGAKGGSGV